MFGFLLYRSLITIMASKEWGFAVYTLRTMNSSFDHFEYRFDNV